MMKKLGKKILSYIFAVCMLASSFGDPSLYVSAEPAVRTWELTASDGDTYRVTVSWDTDSGIPGDAELRAEELTEDTDPLYGEYVARSAEAMGTEAEKLDYVRAFDIALTDPVTGEEYEPSGSVKVSIRLLDRTGEDDLTVVHFAQGAEGETGEPELLTAETQGDTVNFETQGFSVYVVTENTFLCTYYFYSYNNFGEYQAYMFYDEQGNQVSAQTIKNGETLVTPLNPPRNPLHPEAEFKGWYKGSSETDLEPEPFDFTQPQAYTSENQETSVNLYAVFADFAYVTFHGQYDSDTQAYPVSEVIRVELEGGSHILEVDELGKFSVPYYNAGGENGLPAFEFDGWSRTPIPTAGEGQSDKIHEDLTITGDTELYPVFRQVHWLSFASGNSGTGATYYAPVSITAGYTLDEQVLQERYIPQRPGYAFLGWYLGVENEGTDAQNGTGLRLTDSANNLYTISGDTALVLLSVAGNADDGYLQLSQNVTLYAAWEASQAAYTIVTWKQRATDEPGLDDGEKTYDYAESFPMSGTPGEVISVITITPGDPPIASADTTGPLAVYEALNDPDQYNLVHSDAPLANGDANPYLGYTLNAAKTLTDTTWDLNTENYTGEKTVSYDGTTVFNLYYDKGGAVSAGTGPVSLTFHFIDEADGATDTTYPGLAIGGKFERGDPAAPITAPSPARTTEAMPGYEFGWYYDPGCTAKVDLTAATMPDHDLTLYGGWTKEWYLIQIDPNYGDLHSNGSTYFWKTYRSDYIQEYTWVTRDYVPSESGSWYFVNHDYAYVQANGGDRYTYYTEDISQATDLTTFRSAPGVYLYDGWYQVNRDGTETPYEFGQLIEGNTTLRLHWKLAGTHYLNYNTDVTENGVRLAGRLSDGSISPNAEGYTDQAGLILNGYADAPEGYTFIGWKVRGDDSGKVYHPGDRFTLAGDLAVTVNGKKTVYLDAIYTKIKTATIIYDANGGTVSDTADSGYPYKIDDASGNPVLDGENKPVNLNTHTVSRSSGKLTVTGLVNNSPILLSSGVGFTAPVGSGAVFSGWNTEPDGSGNHFAPGSYEDARGKYYVDIDDPVTLYAEWKITVCFDKNEANYSDAAFSDTGWNSYTLNGDGQYSIETYVHALLTEPAGTVTKEGMAFDFWSTMADGNEEHAFDFAKTKLTHSLTLYAHLAKMVKLPYHVVSTNRVEHGEWKNTDKLRVLDSAVNGIEFTDAGSLSAYVTPESGDYTYAYACLSDSAENIGEANKINAITYHDGTIQAKLENGTDVVLYEDGKDESGRQIYLVYSIDNADPQLKLAYVMGGESGGLTSIDPVNYKNAPFTSLNGSLVPGILNEAAAAGYKNDGNTATGQVLTLREEPLEVSQRYGSGVFNAPPLLDDPAAEPGNTLTLVHDFFGVGTSGAANVSEIGGKGNTLYLRYYDGRRQWSLDGAEWEKLDGDTLYVCYRQRGSELRITAAVVGENTGISSNMSFEVTITSNAITRTSYNTEGTGHAAVAAIPTAGSEPGSITLTVKDGSDIRIKGLGNGDYTVTEKYSKNYTLEAKVEEATVAVAESEGSGSVTFHVNADTKVDLLNTPFEICRVYNSNTLSSETFYTLNRALEYIQNELEGVGTIELLRDYVIPDWDALEIHSGFEITLKSKTSDNQTYTISRDETFTSAPLIRNYGTLTLENVTLDGAHVASGSSQVYNLGMLSVKSGATLQNAEKTGSGAAIFQERGTLNVENGAVFSNNTSSTGGGAISVSSGTVTISGGTFSGNTAKNGGAIYYSGSEAVTVSGGTFSGNRAANNGGTIYAASGSIAVSGGSFTGAEIESSPVTSAEKGGAIYVENAALTVSGGTFSGIRAQLNGGAVYAEAGSLTLSGGTFTGSNALNGSGGAVYSASGDIGITGGTFTGNTAAGNGGAVWLGSGTLEMSGGTIGGTANNATNGAGLYVDTGSAYLSGGSVTGNIASAGGAVGVGSLSARLYFSGGVKVTGNASSSLPTNNQKCNVYLDRDSVDVITLTGLTNKAAVGVFVSDNVMDARGVPGAKFATYTDDANKNKVTNDRDDSFAVISETASKKLYWGKAISIVVRYQSSSFMSKGFPPRDTDWQKKKTIDSYYPVMGDGGNYVALSAVAEDLYKNHSLGLSGTAAYAGAFFLEDPVTSHYDDYFTKLSWDKVNSRWELTKHDDTTKVPLGSNTLIIYYAEPAYISIENNTDMALTISDIVLGTGENAKSVVNTATVAGYGMVFAKNGAIRSALLPVKAGDLVLAAGNSVTLLIPGGRNTNYTLTGTFTTDEVSKAVQLRTTNSGGTGLDSTTITVGHNVEYTLSEKKTLNKAGTYQIIFGDDKQICKIYTQDIVNVAAGDYLLKTDEPDESGKTEYVFKSLNQAMAFVKTYMNSSKTAVIEMLTDYLLPASDLVRIPRGYDITLTTAQTGSYQYVSEQAPKYKVIVKNRFKDTGNVTPSSIETDEYGRTVYLFDSKDAATGFATTHGLTANDVLTTKRATISRDSDNKESMIDAWNDQAGKDTISALDGTTLRISDLVFDGKSVQGSSDGGGVKSKYVNVYISNVEFKNVYAQNGGAMLIMFSAKDKNNKVTVPGTVLEVKNSSFDGCTSTTTETSNRLGGGAIVTNAETMTLAGCVFDTCTAVDQAGAVFHRVDGNYNSWTNISGCFFTNCQARAAGGLELDSKTITVSDTDFEHCVATQRNGGGFNVWPLNSGTTSSDCWVTVTGCTFYDCRVSDVQSNGGNGGGFRCAAVYTKVENCTFTNNRGYYGGGFCVSNANAKKAEIYGSSFEFNTANQGGGVLLKAKEVIIGDWYYYLDDDGNAVTVKKDGDVYKYLDDNVITDTNILSAIQARHTEVKNCTASGNGGGVYHDRDTDGSSLAVTNAVITGNTSTGNNGGGIAIYRVRSATFTGCNISNNIAKKQGGGIWIGENDVKTRTLVIDSSTIRGNSSSDVGGGVYSFAQLTLRNNTTITGNRITTTPSDASTNAGGVYLPNGYKLTVGTAGASGLDSTTVKDNTNGSGAPSDVRLWWDNNKQNSNAGSVSVLCGLDGEIRVVNPGKTTQQFGTRTADTYAGFTEGSHVFVADSGGLYGVFDRANPLNLIWRGGVVCKITDASGRLLYLDADCKDPAVFDRLDHRTDGSKLSPFSYLRQASPALYRKDNSGQGTAIDLGAEEIKIKLLVSTFETDTYITTGSYASRKLVTLTTASSTDTDGYPYTGRAGTYATIKRGYSGNSLIQTEVNLKLTNITLDGSSTDKTTPRSANVEGGLIKANSGGITVTLAANSILQNSSISNGKNGGGVYVNNGASLIIAGGAIYNCSTTGDGGGVYVTDSGTNNRGTLTFNSGNISKCSAKNGGGVRFEKGTSFELSGSARITGCTATEKGGGVFLNAQKTMNMSGGSITGNHAGTDGGGIYLGDHKNTRLNISGRVTVSGNTAVKDGQNVPCNVELVTDSNDIINSAGTGIARNSYIGVYVPGAVTPDFESYLAAMASPQKTQYHKHGMVSAPFGKFERKVNTNYLYCFVNDRNGLKGGLQLGDDVNMHWVRIFSLQVSKTVISGLAADLAEEFTFRVTFSKAEGGTQIPNFDTYFTYDDGRVDESDNPVTIQIKNGFAEFTLKNGESVTVDNLPAEIDSGHVYYKVEEVLSSERAAHYTTSTARSSGTSGDHSVSGTIGENLQREDVNSKYQSDAYFDNLNAVCKLTSSKNGGVLLYTLDAHSEKPVPAVYSTLHSSSNDGAFDVINARTDLYYFNAFTNRYEKFDYDGTDTLSVEMLVENYEMERAVDIKNGVKVTLTTAKTNATDGYRYVGTPGTYAKIVRKIPNGNKADAMFQLEKDKNGELTLKNITLDGNKGSYTSNGKGGIVRVNDGCRLTITTGAVLENSKNSNGGAAV